MSTRILIVGAGGLAKELTDLALLCGFEPEAYFTEQSATILHPMQGVRIVNDLEAVDCEHALIAVGDTSGRERLSGLLAGRFQLPTLIHPSASVSASARIGEGVIVMQNVVISADAEVADGVLVNVACYVAHDCRVGAHAHLAACVQMGGGASVGTRAFCGTSSVLLPNIEVGSDSILGAGAVVTKDVPGRSLAVGVPARVVKSL